MDRPVDSDDYSTDDITADCSSDEPPSEDEHPMNDRTLSNLFYFSIVHLSLINLAPRKLFSKL